jgi:hypothetical protein
MPLFDKDSNATLNLAKIMKDLPDQLSSDAVDQITQIASKIILTHRYTNAKNN